MRPLPNQNVSEIPVEAGVPSRPVLWILGVALACFVTGKLGGLFALPPGYATVLSPPAGIALAGILIVGYRAWPGVFLGSFLVAVTAGPDSASPTGPSTLLALTIGGGAALQAVVGAFLVRRFAAFPNALASEKEVLSFLGLGGLAACLLNATVATTALYAGGWIPASNLLDTFGTWWIGDVMGVFIFTPLLLAWGIRPDALWRQRRIMLTLPVALTFILTIAVVTYSLRWERERLEVYFDLHSNALVAALEKALDSYMGILQSLQSFHIASDHITREEFRNFTNHYLKDFGTLQALSWNPRVTDDGRDQFVQAIRREGYPDFDIMERDETGRLAPASRRSTYVVVNYIEPLRGNEPALGFDVYSNPIRQAALDHARDTGRPVATGRIRLVQEQGEQAGVLIFMPVYRNGLPHDTVEEKRRNLQGYMVGVLRMHEALEAFMEDVEEEGVIHRLIDETEKTDEKVLFECEHADEHSDFILEDTGGFVGAPRLRKEVSIPFGQRQWRFEVEAAQEFHSRLRSEGVWLIQVGWLVLTGIIGTFVLVASGRGSLLQRAVEERTADLSRLGEEMKTILQSAGEGIFGIDVEGRVIFANTATARLLGWSEGELSGKPSHEVFHHTHADGTHYPAEDCPIYKTCLDGEQRKVEDDLFWRKNGTSFPVQYVASPRREEGRIVGAVVVFEDITERKTAMTELERSNAELQQFAYVSSHDLREPLRMVSSYLQLLERKYKTVLDQDAMEYIDFAVGGAKRMDALIKDLLEYSRVETHGEDFEPVDSQEALLDALDNLQSSIAEAGGRVTLEDLPMVLADRHQLQRLFQNLIGNALKYRRPDHDPDIHVGVEIRRNRVTFHVRDNGIGIAPEYFERIFVIFQRLHGREEFSGTGIGLAICKKIVERHGGRIWVESEPGTGSQFSFTLTAAAD